MDETYIIIEEDNERKILLEGQEIKEAHREAENRYRHLVDPPAGGDSLEALRQAFLHRAAPESADEKDPSPENPEEEPPPKKPESPEELPNEPAGPESADEEDPSPESPEEEPSPKNPEPPEELPNEPAGPEPSGQEEKPIGEQVRELIEKYKAQRPEAEPERTDARPEIPYTVLKESEVEILENAGSPKDASGGNPAGGTGRHIPVLWAAAGILLLCLICIYFLWK